MAARPRTLGLSVSPVLVGAALALGILSIASAWAYMGGPWPIAYTPLGELFVVAFFGIGAVGGTYWLCTGMVDAPSPAAGLALGLMAGAVLLVNNFRDRESDARVGRRTLAIVAGSPATAIVYAAAMLAPYALLVPIARAVPGSMPWPALVALPLALILIHRFVHEPPGAAFNRVRWYIERTVWLIAGIVQLASTLLAVIAHPAWIGGVIVTALVSINVAFTGFCPVGNVLKLMGFEGALGPPRRDNLYFMQTDSWYLERRIYVTVGINIILGSTLFLVVSPWWALFPGFVGLAMLWFAASGLCILANLLYRIGAEPRLRRTVPEAAQTATSALS